MSKNIYSYVSCRADYDPARTYIVFPPSETVNGYEEAEQFAKKSGWITAAEYEKAVLLVYIPEAGYSGLSPKLAGEIAKDYRNAFESRNGRSLYARGGKIWCWETMVYLTGYGDGAVFAGDCVVADPSSFAAAALVGGVPAHYEAGDELSAHPFVREVREGYSTRCKEIPVALCLYGASEAEAAKVTEYFPKESKIACRPFNGEYDLDLTFEIVAGYNRIIRWKNGPDGTLSSILPPEDFYTCGKFIQESVTVGTVDYPVALHLPAGKSPEDVKGLPLVFSLHGRGEPAWQFSQKNGWCELCDEEGDFVLAFPDSPGNLWHFTRDCDAVPAMIELLCGKYELDRERVYLTGFSNGASMTRELGTSRTELFAGLSPWNGPVSLAGELLQPTIMPGILDSGCEIPYFVIVGNQDPAARVESIREQLAVMLPVNRCFAEENVSEPGGFVPDGIRTGENFYTADAGYRMGERFTTRLYRNEEGIVMSAFTIMADMPHGAIAEEAKACWEFLKRFRRPEGSKKVEIIG